MAADLSGSLKKKLVESALLAADWYVNTQASGEHDANRGRFYYFCSAEDGKVQWAGSWLMARSIMALLGAYHRSRERKYLTAAVLGGEYLKSLQILDPGDSRHHGAIRETTPQTRWLFPRDAIEGALGLFFLYRETGDEEYLRRAQAYRRWHLKYAVDGSGWPFWAYHLDTDKVNPWRGFFQIGGGQFYYWLSRVTREKKRLEKELFSLAEKYFGAQRKDGSLEARAYNPALERFEREEHAGGDGNVYNDDGGSLCLLSAYALSGKNRYLEAAVRFADWLLDHQNPDGSYEVADGAACGILLMVDLHRVTGRKDYLESSIRSAGYLLGIQNKDSANPLVYGGFSGETEKKKEGKSHLYVSNRVTSYAVMALLKLEGEIVDPYYSVFGPEGTPIRLGPVTGPARRSGKKTVCCPFTAVPPDIDGKLDAPAWRKAARIAGFVEANGAAAGEQTEVRLLHDGRYLYAAFRCLESRMDSIREKCEQRDSPVWEDDSVYLSLDDGRDRRTFYHFAVNPKGTVYDAKIRECPAPSRFMPVLDIDDRWNHGVRIATSRGTREWRVELAIELSGLGIGRPGRGTRLGFFVGRVEKPHREMSGWVGTDDFARRPALYGYLVLEGGQ